MTKKISQNQIEEKLREVMDPELGVNIVDLGLVYQAKVKKSQVEVKMTLTSPGCPLGGMIARQVEEKLKELPEIEGAKVEFTFDPPWTPAKMTPEIKAKLGL